MPSPYRGLQLRFMHDAVACCAHGLAGRLFRRCTAPYVVLSASPALVVERKPPRQAQNTDRRWSQGAGAHFNSLPHMSRPTQRPSSQVYPRGAAVRNPTLPYAVPAQERCHQPRAPQRRRCALLRNAEQRLLARAPGGAQLGAAACGRAAGGRRRAVRGAGVARTLRLAGFSFWNSRADREYAHGNGRTECSHWAA